MPRHTSIIVICLIAVLATCQSSRHGEHQVEKVVIHYMQWDLESYRAMTCDDVKCAPDSVVVTEPVQIGNLIEAVSHSRTEQLANRSYLDARICCCFITKDHQIFRNISFGTGSAMQFDGVVYQLDTDLLKVVTGYLPAGYRTI